MFLLSSHLLKEVSSQRMAVTSNHINPQDQTSEIPHISHQIPHGLFPNIFFFYFAHSSPNSCFHRGFLRQRFAQASSDAVEISSLWREPQLQRSRHHPERRAWPKFAYNAHVVYLMLGKPTKKSSIDFWYIPTTMIFCIIYDLCSFIWCAFCWEELEDKMVQTQHIFFCLQGHLVVFFGLCLFYVKTQTTFFGE